MSLDERGRKIFGAILQGALKAGRTVMPALGQRSHIPSHKNGFGVRSEDYEEGPCCAVGAGILFARPEGTIHSPLESFATIHEVSMSYARGVSDGFEGVEHFGPGITTTRNGSSLVLGHHAPRPTEEILEDYNQGRAVGLAVFEHYYGTGTVRP